MHVLLYLSGNVFLKKVPLFISVSKYVFKPQRFLKLIYLQTLEASSLPGRACSSLWLFFKFLSGVSPPDESMIQKTRPKLFMRTPDGGDNPLQPPHDAITNSTPDPHLYAPPPGPSEDLSTLHQLSHHLDVTVTSPFLKLLLSAILNNFKRWMQWANLTVILLLGDTMLFYMYSFSFEIWFDHRILSVSFSCISCEKHQFFEHICNSDSSHLCSMHTVRCPPC